LVVPDAQGQLRERTTRHSQRRFFPLRDGWHVQAGRLCFGDREMAWQSTALARIPGRHNASNACAMLTAFDALHGDDDTGDWRRPAVQSLARFEPLPHRLQWLGRRNAVE